MLSNKMQITAHSCRENGKMQQRTDAVNMGALSNQSTNEVCRMTKKIVPNEVRIESMADIAKLTPAQFERMLPDLFAWYEFAQRANLLPAESRTITHAGFVWVDDGIQGKVTHIELHDLETNVVHTAGIGTIGESS